MGALVTMHSLAFGSDTLEFDLPGADLLQVPEPKSTTPPQDLIDSALRNPIGSPPLEQLVRPGEKVAIVTSDITRYTGSEFYLPLLFDRLVAAGIHTEDILLVIGLGIHRKQSAAEHRKIAGSLFGRIRIEDHECDDPAKLVDLGFTDDGLPAQINRSVVEADRVIVTGTVGVHYFAGFGGGRKGLVPGVASRQTCMATHFKVFNPPEVGGKHPLAAPAVLEGNPIHRAILAAAKKVRPDFLLNTVLTTDKRIAGVFCGDLEQAHIKACEQARQLYVVERDDLADLAIISCGGYPKDINFIQAHKALDYGVRALRPGGTAILLAECRDGFGNPTFFDWFRHQDLDEFETALRENYEINGQTAHATLAKARNYRVILVSSFSREQTMAMGMEKAETLDAALEMAYDNLPARARSVVIPDGGTVLPFVQ